MCERIDSVAMARAPTMDWRAAVREGIYPVAFAAKMAQATNATVASSRVD
jgi:hypothetical protein